MNPLIYLKDIQYKYLNLIIELIYTGKCDIEITEIEQLLSVGRYLGISGLEKFYHNITNIVVENSVSEEHNHENIEIENEEKDWVFGNMIKRKYMIENTDSSQQRSVEFGCYACDAIYRHRGSLYRHMHSEHVGVKYECNQCDYRAAT